MGEDGIPHGVVDSITAHQINMKYFSTSPKKTVIIGSTTDLVMVDDMKGNKAEKKVQWVQVQIDRAAHMSVTKHCSPTECQIMCSSILYPQCEDIDVLVILGEPLLPTSDYYVLACLFLRKHSLEGWDWTESHLLFNHLKSLLPKGGYETARTGGALGLCMKTDETRTFIYRKGSFPRHRSSCRLVIMNSVSRCGVMCFYCTKKTKEYTCWFYPTPRIGRHVKINDRTTRQYPFFHFPRV